MTCSTHVCETKQKTFDNLTCSTQLSSERPKTNDVLSCFETCMSKWRRTPMTFLHISTCWATEQGDTFGLLRGGNPAETTPPTSDTLESPPGASQRTLETTEGLDTPDARHTAKTISKQIPGPETLQKLKILWKPWKLGCERNSVRPLPARPHPTRTP